MNEFIVGGVGTALLGFGSVRLGWYPGIDEINGQKIGFRVPCTWLWVKLGWGRLGFLLPGPGLWTNFSQGKVSGRKRLHKARPEPTTMPR